jgi:hypothetical protein
VNRVPPLVLIRQALSSQKTPGAAPGVRGSPPDAADIAVDHLTDRSREAPTVSSNSVTIQIVSGMLVVRAGQRVQ